MKNWQKGLLLGFVLFGLSLISWWELLPLPVRHYNGYCYLNLLVQEKKDSANYPHCSFPEYYLDALNANFAGHYGYFPLFSATLILIPTLVGFMLDKRTNHDLKNPRKTSESK